MKWFRWLLIVLFLASCGAPRPPEARVEEPSSPQVPVQSFPEKMTFEGVGKASEFAASRKMAYQDVMRKALVTILGEKSYSSQKNAIDGQFLNTEAQFSPYILQKEWTSTKRDDNGDLILALRATIATKKLREDLQAAGFLGGGSVTQPSSPVAAPEMKEERKTSEPEPDLSSVDISGLSILIYYNPSALKKSSDADAEKYARRAVQLLNQELLQNGIQVFDLESAEKIAQEKNLLQEEARGNVGLGLLLAQQVYAELYGEVTPTVTYRQGTTAHVILDLKLYVRTGARVIASIQKGGQEYDSPSLEASITASMRDGAKKVTTELLTTLKKYVSGGRFYTVRLIEVGSARDATSFASTVSKLERVKSVKQTLYSKNDRTAEYEVQFQGNPNELMEIIFDGVTTKPGFEALDLSTLRGNELIFTMQ
ncbi:MAG: hypothetical protein N2314_05200 [Brevinematales bacterium]|nr:hypothetical protein [Brevinematales bacterium]